MLFKIINFYNYYEDQGYNINRSLEHERTVRNEKKEKQNPRR